MRELARDDYLGALEQQLPFPADRRREIVEEIAAHLDDAVAAGRSETEAQAGLGTPAELADALSRPERTPTRLLAAAGAGVRAAIGPWIYGYLLASVVGMVAFLLVALVASLVAQVLRLDIQIATSGGWNTAITAVPIAVGLYLASRAATAAASIASRRLREQVRPWVVVIGTAAAAAVLLLIIHAPQNIASVIALSIAPLAVTIGAYRPALLPQRPRAPLWMILGLIALIPLGLLSSIAMSATIGHGEETPGSDWQRRTDQVGPWWPPTIRDSVFFSSGWSSVDESVTAEWELETSGALIGLRDLRVEAWHGMPDPTRSWRLDPRYDAPFATGSVRRDGTNLSGTVVPTRHPFVDTWELVLTGVGPDGVRYVVDTPGGGTSTFQGSAWDWAVAVSDLLRHP